MNFRTDLALETAERTKNTEGIEKYEKVSGDIKTTHIKVIDKSAAERIKKPIGSYITVEFPFIGGSADDDQTEKAITDALDELLPESRDTVLVVGLGNREITPDAVGPDTASKILATRHIAKEFAEEIGLKGLKSVAALAPNVLGKTGIEAAEIIKGTVDRIKPSAVIAVDALASGSIGRLFSTVQLCDSGISPGSGVKNARKEISEKTLGVPVIAVGVPTVVDAGTLAGELTGESVKIKSDMIVTPKDIDLLCGRMSALLARAINVFLQPDLEKEVILSLIN